MARATGNRPKVTVAQLRILLEAVESDPTLYNAGNSDMITFLNVDKWLDLASKLNDCDGGARVSVPNWKYVLRYWSENMKKKMKLPNGKGKPNPAITPEEAQELAVLEKRLIELMKREDAREIVDVTYMGKLGGNPKPEDENDGNTGSDGVKFVIQLLNVFSTEPDENTSPEGPKKRTIIMKGDDPCDPTGKTKKFKIIYNQNVDDEGEPQKQILENQLDRLQFVSRELEDHISAIQSRIHMIKDMWKHRCGDN